MLSSTEERNLVNRLYGKTGEVLGWEAAAHALGHLYPGHGSSRTALLAARRAGWRAAAEIR